MKKYLTIIVTVFLVTVLTSCGNDSDDVDTIGADRTTISLAVVDLVPLYEVDEITWFVSMFNTRNRHYRIEVINYTNDDLMRLRTEVMAGGGPDIVYSLFYEDSLFRPMMNRGILADLWPFIDSDPKIGREDFFQNILEAKQSPDGSLQLIANQFTIDTIISIPSILDSPESFTTAKFLELTRDAIDTGMTYPMGNYITGSDFFLMSLLLVDFGIIDLDAGVSDFETQKFYDLLDITSLLPGEAAMEPNASIYRSMTTGEQLFTNSGIPNAFLFARYETILGLDDFIILGYPSDAGGIHGAYMRSNIGINASSDYQDAAWSFIRSLLLNTAPLDIQFGFPVRIDAFEEQLEVAMELSWVTHDGGVQIRIHGLTEDGASDLRELVESISFVSHYNQIILEILMDELSPFLAGNRTAEDTARVMQNRVQMYLHERG